MNQNIVPPSSRSNDKPQADAGGSSDASIHSSSFANNIVGHSSLYFSRSSAEINHVMTTTVPRHSSLQVGQSSSSSLSLAAASTEINRRRDTNGDDAYYSRYGVQDSSATSAPSPSPSSTKAFLLSPIREPNNRGIILKQLPEALSEGFRAGVSGGAAMCAQITTFMWLHTIMRYQFRHGSGVLDTIKALYHDGGFLRFYRGYGFAIMYAPLIRGGSTASNQASLTFLESINSDIPLWIKTLTSASCAALWKVTFTPLDMMQTTLQVGGSVGQKDVANKIKKHGLTILWHGSSALYVSALVGNFSWFAVYNSLNRSWSNHDTLKMQTLRDGSIGVLSTLTSDVSTNFLEVLKTHRQTTRNSVGYVQALSEIVGSDGLVGLVTRGLKVRLLTNCCQGAFFTIVWGKIQRRCFPLHLKPTTSE